MRNKIRFGFANGCECTRLGETRKYWCCDIFLGVEALRPACFIEDHLLNTKTLGVEKNKSRRKK
jgi:hypothetical protein